MIWAIDDQILESHLLSQANLARIEVRRRCSDAVELLAASSISPGVPVLVSAQLPRISPEILNKIAEEGRRVILLAHSAQQEDLVRSWAIGTGKNLPTVLRIDLPFSGITDCDLSLLFESVPSPFPDTEPVPAALQGSSVTAHGQVVCMWSAMGSTGRSTLALGLAESWSEKGERVLLIDADTYAPSLGTALGMSDEISGLVVASRYADHNALDERTLSSACREIHKGLWILTGISDPARWPEVQPQSLKKVIDTSRQYFDRVVIDISAVMPEAAVSVLGQDLDPVSRLTPVRNQAAVTALTAAEIVAIVIRPDAVGAARLVQDFGRHAHYFAHACTLFLLNRVGKSQADATVKEFERICAMIGARTHSGSDKKVASTVTIAAVPEDPVVSKLIHSAATMREGGSRSAIFRSLNRLVAELGRGQNYNKVTNFGPFIKFLSIGRRHAYTTASGNG